MEQQTRSDLTFSGSGTSSGGIFNHVTVNGHASISGDLDCIELTINGASEVGGSVKARETRINGSVTIDGSMESDSAGINGRASIRGDVKAGILKVNGSADVKGMVTAEGIEVHGSIRADGDCNAETFTTKGSFTIAGLLNAGTVDIALYGDSQAREIGGERIDVRKGRSNAVMRFIESLRSSSANLSAETIEGDDIYLEHTRAKVVRGRNIHLGPGCEVDMVEYTENFEQDQNAKVNQSTKG